ncbi:serine/threonine-protein kinase [Streptomyces sp. NPDC047046]|uniref:serine/threonine-protein kinase n=1 Tax=Streptomyces sp. NPDC047046 TaxID=3155378 RepID=UPI0033F1B5DC
MPQRLIAERYELLEELSHGGMGDVWRGYDAVLDRPVAVKLIRQQAVTSAQLATELAKRFRREARVTARIQHPGVPQVYDAVLDKSHDQLFLVMELVEGLPLAEYVNPARPLPVAWAVAVAVQVATVLSYAHDVPAIHRDLKPGNIFVARDGTVKVLDFGIAAVLRTDATKLTATGTPLGTSQYMAPEQVRAGRITPQTDLYALGCVLHELLAGRPLFQAENEFQLMYQHLNAAPVPLRQLRPEVPTVLEELVLHLLRKAPEARPADSQEVYERLRPLLPAGGSSPEAGESGPAGAPDPTRLFRDPYAPKARPRPPTPAGFGPPPHPFGSQAAPATAALRADIAAAWAHSHALLEEERFVQAAEVLGEVIEPAAHAFGTEGRHVLKLRRQRAAIQLLGGDYRAALPEFTALADAYGRINGRMSAEARACQAQAARCRAELGQVTEALTLLGAVLAAVRSVDGDASEEALELRRDLGLLLLSQGRADEARALLEPLLVDLGLVYGPDDEFTREIAEALAVIRLELDAPGAD